MSSITKKSERNEGIELLRIVAMFMIVCMHCLRQGGILHNTTVFSLNYNVAYFLEILCYGAVNLYALTSGYVCIFSKNNKKRLLNLWFEVVFCSIVITIVLFLLPQYSISKDYLLFSPFPLLTGKYWYFTSYIFVFIISNFLNFAIKSLTQKQLFNIIFIIFILFSFITLFKFIFNSSDLFEIKGGYTPIWLTYLYLFGAYIRLYGLYKLKNIIYLILYIFFSIISFLCFIGSEYIKMNYNITPKVNFLSYTSPIVVVSSVFLFLFFINLKLSFFKKFIFKFSSVSFFVYIISVHPLVFNFVQKDILIEYSNANVFVMIFMVLLYSFCIYMFCSLFGFIIKKIFKIFRFDILSEKIYTLLLRFFNFVYCTLNIKTKKDEKI